MRANAGGSMSCPTHLLMKTGDLGGQEQRRKHGVFLILGLVIYCQDLFEAWYCQLSKEPIYLFRRTRHIFLNPPY